MCKWRTRILLMEMDWLTPEIILTIYAAIISTMALIWNIVLSVLEKRSRLKIIVEFKDSFTVSNDGKPIKGPRTLYIRIINRSKYIKYVSGVNIKLPYQTDTGNMYSLFKKNTQLPIALEAEKEYIYKFILTEENSVLLLKNYKVGKCRVIVIDTILKKYNSHRFSIEKIKQAINFNAKIQPEVLEIFGA